MPEGREILLSRWMIAIALAGSVLSTPALAAKSTKCTDPDTDEKYSVQPRKLPKQVKAVQRDLKQRAIHMLDLTSDSHDARRSLVTTMAGKDWCAAARHLRQLEDDLGLTDVTGGFVAKKFSRVERWIRGAQWPENVRAAAERYLVNAAAQISEGDSQAANRMLNRAMNELFRLRSGWDLPASLPEVSSDVSGGEQAEINEEDVENGCPKLFKKGRGDAEDLREARRRLQRVLNKRKIRLIDIKGGAALIADLNSYRDLRAVWPAIRVTCALIRKTKETEIDLGFTMARYLQVNKLKRASPPADETRFKELVRATSDAIAERKYEAAHEHLEELYVLLGQPSSPSHFLD